MNDKEIIESLGGPTAVAKRIGVKPQVVCNWRRRGIPPKRKLEFPFLFLYPQSKKNGNEKSDAKR